MNYQWYLLDKVNLQILNLGRDLVEISSGELLCN